MLKKITLAFVAVGLITAISYKANAQVSISGNVKATAVLQDSVEVTNNTNSANSSAMGLTTASAAFSFSYSADVLSGWKATAGFGLELPNGRDRDTLGDALDQDFDLGQDGNYYVSLENDMVKVVLGDTRYLGSVASMGGWESVNYVLGDSIADNGDKSNGRDGAIGVSVKSIPNVSLMVGFSSHSSSSDSNSTVTTGTGDSATTSPVPEVATSASEFGLLGKYSANGLQAGLQYVSTSQSTETLVGDFTQKGEATSNKTFLTLGASYSLSAVTNVPVDLWFGYRQATQTEKNNVVENDDGTSTFNYAGDIEYDVASGTYSAMSFGAKYSFAAGDVGINIDTVSYDKTGTPTATTDGTTTTWAKGVDDNEGASSTGLALWANYNLGPSTLLFGSYSSTTETGAKPTAEAQATEITSSGIQVGLKQSF